MICRKLWPSTVIIELLPMLDVHHNAKIVTFCCVFKKRLIRSVTKILVGVLKDLSMHMVGFFKERLSVTVPNFTQNKYAFSSSKIALCFSVSLESLSYNFSNKFYICIIYILKKLLETNQKPKF